MTHPTPGASAPINPLIENDGFNVDTANNIRCALEFLADAIPAISRSGFTRDAAHGAHLLLRTCAVALEACHV